MVGRPLLILSTMALVLWAATTTQAAEFGTREEAKATLASGPVPSACVQYSGPGTSDLGMLAGKEAPGPNQPKREAHI